MIKKKSDIHIDVNRIDKINLYKFPFINDNVPNITEQIEKRLKYIKDEKERLIEESLEKQKFLLDNPFKRTKKKTFIKRKTKKTFKLRQTILDTFKKQILDINHPINQNLEKSLYSRSDGTIDSKKDTFLYKNNKLNIQSKNQSKFRNSVFFITQEKHKKNSLLHLSSNFSRNFSESNVAISPLLKFNFLKNNNNNSEEDIQLISNSKSSSFSDEYDMFNSFSNNLSFGSDDSKNKKRTFNSKSEVNFLKNMNLKKSKIPHPIYKHLNSTLENTKKIQNEIINYSNSFSENNPYKNEKENNEYLNKMIPLDKKEQKFFIYKLGYYLSLDPKFKDPLSTTKTISLLNPISSFTFKNEIGKEMKINIKYEPLDKFKIIRNKFFENAFKKPKWVDKKNLEIKNGFKDIYNKLERNKLDLKKIKKKHNF